MEPVTKRVISFVDGQNLFYGAKKAFGYSFPNYDPLRLTELVAGAQGWTVVGTHFYTGVPKQEDSPFWNHFWTAKCGAMGTQGVVPFTRELRYRDETIDLPGGGSTTVQVGQEKGIDIRIALDIVRLARADAFDVALVFSQDQDFSEVADEIRAIARERGRWIKIASAYPLSPTSTQRRGIDRTDWLPLDRATYDSAIDHRDYRPKPASGGTTP